MRNNFYLYAPQVYQGGGKVLLEALLKNPLENMSCHVIVDERLSFSPSTFQGWRVKTIKSSFISRFACEKWLSSAVKGNDTVLFYSNLPPLFKIKGKKVLFLQNRYLIDDQTLNRNSYRTRIRYVVQRLWFRAFIGRVSEVIVQTDSMARLFRERISKSIELRVVPFVGTTSESVRSIPSELKSIKKGSDFLYVANGEPHKNHKRLIEAWGLLASEGIKPILHITIDADVSLELGSLLSDAREKYEINVVNHGVLPHDKVLELFDEADALIYPSLFESFGVPLVEASTLGVPILASELDYVYDVCEPLIAFNPLSSRSISRAVKRFLEVKELQVAVSSPAEFLDYVILDRESDFNDG